MINVIISPKDTRYLFFTSDNPHEVVKINKYFNKIPQYQLLPTFRGIPTPEVFVDKFNGKDGKPIYYMASGLWRNLQMFCESQKIQISSIDKAISHSDDPITKEEFKELTKGYIQKFKLRDDQIFAAWKIIKYKQSLSELCTRYGKTAMIACTLRYLQEHRNIKKSLIIVPSIHLIKQGIADFSEYMDFFKSGEVWAGADIVGDENLIIGTFQSLVLRLDPRSKKYDPNYFNGIDCVVVDEVHKAACKSIKTILSADFMKNVRYKFGVTGTLPKEHSIESFAIQSLMGPKIQEISARELIDSNILADPVIKQFRLQYDPASLNDITIQCGEYLLSSYAQENGLKVLLPQEKRRFTMIHKKILPIALKSARQTLDANEYKKYITSMCAASSRTLNLEQMITMFSKPRLELISTLISNLNKNIIIFAHNTEYINFLTNYLKEHHPEKNIYKITGSTTLKKRQQTLDALLESNNNVLVGSYGVVSTGLTFKNIDYGIFAQSFKADTINRQSLGRLMLRTETKSEFYIYDIVDVYPTKKIYNQGLEKIKIYKSEGHRYEIENRPCIFQPIIYT